MARSRIVKRKTPNGKTIRRTTALRLAHGSGALRVDKHAIHWIQKMQFEDMRKIMHNATLLALCEKKRTIREEHIQRAFQLMAPAPRRLYSIGDMPVVSSRRKRGAGKSTGADVETARAAPDSTEEEEDEEHEPSSD